MRATTTQHDLRPIGTVVTELRKCTGKTQERWAKHMGWSISALRRYEGGGRPGPRAFEQMIDKACDLGYRNLADELQEHWGSRAGSGAAR